MSSELRLRTRGARAVLGWALLASVGLFSVRARADEIDRCLASHPEAQRLRLDGKLRAARTELLVCARPICPAVVRDECGRWLGEVDVLMPSVVISAKTPAGEDLTDVRVTVDGEPVMSRLDGRPLSLDPGPHKVRLEGTGLVPEEQTFLLAEGDKTRRLFFSLADQRQKAIQGTPTRPSLPGASPETTSRPVPASVYVAGGIAAVALASFAVFGLTGRADYFDLKNSCSPNCSSSQDSPVRTRLLTADASLGVAVVALGVGTALFLTRPNVISSGLAAGMRLGLRASADGVAASAAWVF